MSMLELQTVHYKNLTNRKSSFHNTIQQCEKFDLAKCYKIIIGWYLLIFPFLLQL